MAASPFLKWHLARRDIQGKLVGWMDRGQAGRWGGRWVAGQTEASPGIRKHVRVPGAEPDGFIACVLAPVSCWWGCSSVME